MNPVDGAKLGLKTGDSVRVSSLAGVDRDQAQALGRRAARHGHQVLRPGPLGLRPRCGAEDYAKATPRGGNNNEILVDDYDRLSGATARNGGFTGVKVEKA